MFDIFGGWIIVVLGLFVSQFDCIGPRQIRIMSIIGWTYSIIINKILTIIN